VWIDKPAAQTSAVPVHRRGRVEKDSSISNKNSTTGRYIIAADKQLLYCNQNKPMTEQNYKNHGRIVPLFHGFTFLLILAAFIIFIINLFNNTGSAASLLPALGLLLLAVALGFTAFFARTFALKAQDRAIRAEENLRHFILTGKPFDSRLAMGQIIALRFAGDGEFVALAQQAAEQGLAPNAIKQAIQHWRADHNRA
jgi:hypothetical protein